MSKEISKAKKRIKAKSSFYKELGSYVGVSIMLIVINVLSSPGYMWAFWPVGMWGATLVARGIGIAVNDRSEKWERKAIREELQSMGYDPDNYTEEDYQELELPKRHTTLEKVEQPTYRKSDLV